MFGEGEIVYWKSEILNAIAALFTVVIAFSALIVSIMTARYQRRTLNDSLKSKSAELLTSLSITYESNEMRNHRKDFAQNLLSEESRKKIDLGKSSPVLSFFENIGYLTEQGVLNKGMVWNHFSWQIEHYYQAVTASPNLIQKVRDEYKEGVIFRELVSLHLIFSEIYKKERGAETYYPPNESQVKKFLEDEAELKSLPTNNEQIITKKLLPKKTSKETNK